MKSCLINRIKFIYYISKYSMIAYQPVQMNGSLKSNLFFEFVWLLQRYSGIRVRRLKSFDFHMCKIPLRCEHSTLPQAWMKSISFNKTFHPSNRIISGCHTRKQTHVHSTFRKCSLFRTRRKTAKRPNKIALNECCLALHLEHLTFRLNEAT